MGGLTVPILGVTVQAVPGVGITGPGYLGDGSPMVAGVPTQVFGLFPQLVLRPWATSHET